MNFKKIILFIAILLGEIIIIYSLTIFKGGLSNEIFYLNILVATITYILLISDFIFPWIDLNEKSQSKIGSIGVKWFFTLGYSICAVSIIVVCNFYMFYSFSIQLILHGILFFLLLLGIISNIQSSDKTKEVFNQENINRDRLNEMKIAIKNLQNKINSLSGLPENLKKRINIIEDNILFISPANTKEAHDLEELFIKKINDITFDITNFNSNENNIELSLYKCEGIFQSRKQIHSN